VAERPAGIRECLFQHASSRKLPLGDTSQFDARQERFPGRFLEPPLNVKSDAGSLLRMVAQSDLVNVALVQAWGKRIAPFRSRNSGRTLSKAPLSAWTCDEE
jgi:hypothetical protein